MGELTAARDASVERRRPAAAAAIGLLTQYPGGVITEISPQDGMYIHDPSPGARVAYFEHGRAALDAIRLALLAAQKDTVQSILDLPSSFGRVMRFLHAEYPEARLTACDVVREGVDYCAETFGAKRLYGREDPGELQTDERFDLIWCGSLFTHVDAPTWFSFLDFFESVLAPGGVIVLTTHGRSTAAQLRDPHAESMIHDSAREAILSAYEETDFGYADYVFDEEFRVSVSMPESYGISLARPSWVCSLIERRPKLQLLAYMENRWSIQDVVACIAVEEVSYERNPLRIPLVRGA